MTRVGAQRHRKKYIYVYIYIINNNICEMGAALASLVLGS